MNHSQIAHVSPVNQVEFILESCIGLDAIRDSLAKDSGYRYIEPAHFADVDILRSFEQIVFCLFQFVYFNKEFDVFAGS